MNHAKISKPRSPTQNINRNGINWAPTLPLPLEMLRFFWYTATTRTDLAEKSKGQVLEPVAT
jgi:hypothetical protein